LIPFAVLGVLSFYTLARQWGFAPGVCFLGTCVFGVSPAYVVAANLAMPDIAAVSLMLASTTLSVRGFITRRYPLLIAGGVLLGLAPLCRYNALPCLLFLFLLGLTYPRLRLSWIPSATALSLFLFWTFYSQIHWGQTHPVEMISHFGRLEGVTKRFWAMNNHLTFSSFLPFFALLCFSFRRFFYIFLCALGAIFLLGAYIFFQKNRLNLSLWPELIFAGLGVFSLVFLGGISMKAAFPGGPFNRRSRERWRGLILFGWSVTCLFTPLMYIFFSSKSLLMAVPQLILILMAQFQHWRKAYEKAAYGVVCLMGVVSLLVGASYFSLADGYRQAAREALSHPPGGSRVWFTGHWGWQYYLEKMGAFPLPVSQNEALQAGDVVLTAENVAKQKVHPLLTPRLHLFERFSLSSRVPFLTMNSGANAGFYSNAWGSLPYTFSDKPLENFRFYLVR